MRLKAILIILFILITFSCENKNRYIQDYDYLIKVFEDNYANNHEFFEENQYSVSKVLNEYKTNIEFIETDTGFMNILNKIFRQLNDGHVHCLTLENINYYTHVYNEIYKTGNKQYKPWVKVLNNRGSLYDKGREFKPNNSDNSTSSSITFGKINPSSIFIKFPAFDYTKINSDEKLISSFLQDNYDKENLIIDIRDNPGGSTLYWQRNIVGPLINREISYDYYTFYSNGKLLKSFMNSSIMEPINNYDGEIGLNDSFKKYYTHFVRHNNVISPIEPYSSFKNVYLITNEKNFSSSEGFVYFSKMTNFATVVGEQTGGDGMGIDPILILLPKTGLICTLPINTGLNPNGSSNNAYGTTPDIEISQINMMSYDKILNYIDEKLLKETY